MKKISLLFLLLSLFIYPQNKRTLTVDDLWNMKRIESFDVSPDGQKIVFSIVTYSMEKNKGNRDIFIVNADGSGLKAILNSEDNETSPKFIKNGSMIAYLNNNQLYTCDLSGGDKTQLTTIYTGVNDYRISEDGNKILFTSSVYPECISDECNKQKDDSINSSKVKASLFTSLMFRHWNEWRGEKRSHLFYMDINKKDLIDLNIYSKSEVPPIALGSANDFNFSPDLTEAAYTCNIDEKLSFSTNNDIFLISLNNLIKDKLNASKKISTSKGNDNQPVYSPDGKYLAYTSMERAKFEADKLNLIIVDRKSGAQKNVTNNFNLSVGEFSWSNDSKDIYFASESEINKSIFRYNLSSGKIDLIYKDHVNSQLKLLNNTLYFLQERSEMPSEIFRYDISKKSLSQITAINKDLLSQIEMNPAETFWTEGVGGTKIQSIMIKPPFFDPNKKYPMMFLIHGGPQGNWPDEFHYRWNTEMFAAQGYVVIAPNPRGSTGYGQKFTDEISKDWGGKPYIDLMNTYDYAVKNFKFIDKKNTFAAGASYGGYMINWIETHTDRFNALVCHDGVFNLESMYGTTEELWFPEWENGGTPWENKALYDKFSPHRYITNAKTPLLIVHGAMDFRVCEEQAFQSFTSLQKLGVESKLLYFPDEFHFVTKPQNAKLWWNTVFDWFNQHKKENK